jgi:hypothetical protein
MNKKLNWKKAGKCDLSRNIFFATRFFCFKKKFKLISMNYNGTRVVSWIYHAIIINRSTYVFWFWQLSEFIHKIVDGNPASDVPVESTKRGCDGWCGNIASRINWKVVFCKREKKRCKFESNIDKEKKFVRVWEVIWIVAWQNIKILPINHQNLTHEKIIYS